MEQLNKQHSTRKQERCDMSEMFQIFSLLQTTTAISYIIEQSVDDSSVAPLCGLVGGDGFPLNCIG